MTTALVVAIFLFLISAAIMNYAYQALRTEAWMTERAQRSLHPLAWTTAYLVLDQISGDLDADLKFISTGSNRFVSGDTIFDGVVSFGVSIGKDSIDVAIKVSGDSDNNLGASLNPITVSVTATTGGAKSDVVGQIVSNDASPRGIDIIWR